MIGILQLIIKLLRHEYGTKFEKKSKITTIFAFSRHGVPR